MAPKTAFSDRLHAQKYRAQGETFSQAMDRVSGAVAPNDAQFRTMLHEQRFLPGGRIQSSVGAQKRVTPFNCFVSGRIEDSFVDGYGSIMQRAHEAATTMRMGGGIGYDFSTLRPRGASIARLGSQSSGPISFMEIFDAICRCVASSGHRRGAQMGILRVDHPDIEEFLTAKQNSDRLTGFNVSVAITDEFMTCLKQDKMFPLTFKSKVYRHISAKQLWEKILRSTWDWAEPGVVFIDRVNKMNNLWYCETITATNPCGEQPLPANGACLLSSFNLVKYVNPSRKFNWVEFGEDIHSAVGATDQVIDVARYPLAAQEEEALNKRRMGLGVTGMANALEYIAGPYGSAAFLEMEERVLKTLRDRAYMASALLAAERGSFPLFKCEEFLAGEFAKTLSPAVRDLIAAHGLRNSHLLSIAPTGTISLCADNVSSGVEPVFAYEADRIIMITDGFQTYRVRDYGVDFLGHRGKVAAEVTVGEHLDVLAVAQEYVDSAVSKTLNVAKNTPWDQFERVYLDAWNLGAKGCTTFREGGKREGILTATPEDGKACTLDPVTGRKDCE